MAQRVDRWVSDNGMEYKTMEEAVLADNEFHLATKVAQAANLSMENAIYVVRNWERIREVMKDKSDIFSGFVSR